MSDDVLFHLTQVFHIQVQQTEDNKQQQTGFIYIVTTQLHFARFGLANGLNYYISIFEEIKR